MGIPSQPDFLKEGSAHPCYLLGHNLTWTQCTVLGTCMLIDASTLGRQKPDPCHFRDLTNDVTGGTNIPQCADIAQRVYGVPIEQHTGNNVCSPFYLAYQIARGRKAVVQGNTQPDGRGNVNHAVEVNATHGGTPGHPDSYDVYDPWSGGKAVWSHTKLEAFMAALRPWGEGDSRKLGPGKVYCMLGPDVEPHAHLTYAAHVTKPFPDRQRIYSPVKGRKVNVRSGPGTIYKLLGTLPDGTLWMAYQIKGDWSGDHSGTRWVHNSGTTHEGGPS